MKLLVFALAAMTACASTPAPAPAPRVAPLVEAAPPAAPGAARDDDPIAARIARVDEPLAARIARVERGLVRGARIHGVPGAALADRMRAHHVQGLSVAVIDGYRVVWAKAYGFADVEQRTPVEAATRAGDHDAAVAAYRDVLACAARDTKLGAAVNDVLRRKALATLKALGAAP